MVSVIIPAYKDKPKLDKCLEHLKNQTVKVDIFVRDNSEDNVGFTAAINEGIRKYLSGDCRYILILNQDMYLEPDAIQKMTEFMNENPRCGIAGPLQLHNTYNNYVIFAAGLEAFPAGRHMHGPILKFTKNIEIPWASGACMMLRKDMITEIGLFDENLWLIGSDSDYCFTARSRGWQVWTVVAAKGIHDHGVTSRLGKPEVEIQKCQDMNYFCDKWYTGRLYQQLSYRKRHLTAEQIQKIFNCRLQAIEQMKESLKLSEDPFGRKTNKKSTTEKSRTVYI